MTVRVTLPQLLRHHDDVTRAIARLSVDNLVAIWQRSAEDVGADGYPAAASGFAAGGGGGELTAVEAAVEVRWSGRTQADPVRRWADDIFAMLVQMALLARGIDLRRQAIAKVAPTVGRQPAVPECVNCHDPAVWPDRPGSKAGRCQSCYTHRYRHGHDLRPGCCT
jgi:hypothetical protein